MVIMAHYSFLTHMKFECQDIQMKNPFDLISGFGSIKDFWKWNVLSLKNYIFTKDSYNKIKLMVKKMRW